MQNHNTQFTVREQVEETKPVLMATPQAANYLGLSVSTLNKWRVYGQGPKFVKLGRAVRYRVEDLVQFAKMCSKSSTSEG